MSESNQSYSRKDILKYSSIGLLICTSVSYGLLLPLCRTPDSEGNLFFGPSSVVVVECLKIFVSITGLLIKHTRALKLSLQNENYITIPSSSSIEEKEINQVEFDVDVEKRLEASQIGLDLKYSPLNLYDTHRASSALSSTWDDIWNVEALYLLWPAILFVVQNNLQVFSAGYLTPAEFQTFSQTKLITTALFSITILKRQLSIQQWISIASLCIGIIMVRGADSLLGFNVSKNPKGVTSETWTIGVPLLLLACCFSGLASVITEKRLKGKKTCFWAINAQLAVFSLFPSLIPVIINCMARKRFDPLRYFNWMTWAIIFINTFAAFLISIVIKYADCILKGFAVSIALLLTIFTSSFITGLPLTFVQVCGGLVIAFSTFFYGQNLKMEDRK